MPHNVLLLKNNSWTVGQCVCWWEQCEDIRGDRGSLSGDGAALDPADIWGVRTAVTTAIVITDTRLEHSGFDNMSSVNSVVLTHHLSSRYFLASLLNKNWNIYSLCRETILSTTIFLHLLLRSKGLLKSVSICFNLLMSILIAAGGCQAQSGSPWCWPSNCRQFDWLEKQLAPLHSVCNWLRKLGSH